MIRTPPQGQAIYLLSAPRTSLKLEDRYDPTKGVDSLQEYRAQSSYEALLPNKLNLSLAWDSIKPLVNLAVIFNRFGSP